jgi:hypothetical protein
MGLCSDSFGPPFWSTLHLACLGMSNPQALRMFIELYQFVLPCPGCRNHFTQVLKENPIPQTESPLVMFMWSVDVHNIVNIRLDKPIVSYDEAYAFHMGGCDPPSPTFFDFQTIILIIIAFIILIITLIKNIL